jgi:hypothetical protein
MTKRTVPIIEADVSFLNQSSLLSPTPLFTPTEDDNFIVSVYLEISPAAAPSTFLQYVVAWTDDFQQQSRADSANSSPAGATFALSVFRIRGRAGEPITIQTQSPTPAFPYSLYATVESL